MAPCAVCIYVQYSSIVKRSAGLSLDSYFEYLKLLSFKIEKTQIVNHLHVLYRLALSQVWQHAFSMSLLRYDDIYMYIPYTVYILTIICIQYHPPYHAIMLKVMRGRGD